MKKIFLKLLIVIIIVILFLFLVQIFLVQFVRTKEFSMYPTIKESEVLLIDKWFGITDKMPDRGDMVMFQKPSIDYVYEEDDRSKNVVADYSKNTHIHFIKRVIGLPGEHIKISEDSHVYINGELLQEEYVRDKEINSASDIGLRFQFCDVVVPQNCVYLIGDNPQKSADSRSFGCVPIEKIQGKVWLRVFSFGSFGEIKFKPYYKYLR